MKAFAAVLFWIPTFLARGLLIGLGFWLVPFTEVDNKIFGNNEDPEPPPWFEPGWKEYAGAIAGSGLLWLALGCLLTWSWQYWPAVATMVFVSLELAVSKRTRRDYLWRAYRNPANNVRFLPWLVKREAGKWTVTGFEYPEDEVRSRHLSSAGRFTRNGIFAEYWRVWRTEDDDIAEFRIGWKRSGVPGFGPTLQLRRGD